MPFKIVGVAKIIDFVMSAAGEWRQLENGEILRHFPYIILDKVTTNCQPVESKGWAVLSLKGRFTGRWGLGYQQQRK